MGCAVPPPREALLGLRAFAYRFEGRPRTMMPGFAHPFAQQQAGKRGFSALDGPDAAGAKRMCGGFQGFSPAVDIENMAPPQAQLPFAGQTQGAFATHASPHGHVLGMAQHQSQQAHFQLRQQAGGDCIPMIDCADAPGMCDGMDMDSCLAGQRFERFPANAGGVSPTHYHKSTAIGYVPPLPLAGGQEECSIRMWECDFAGKNDYY